MSEPKTLSERVVAPAVLPTPEHALVAEWRPSVPADLDAMMDLERAMGAVDHPEWVTERSELARDFTVSFVDPAVDTILGFASDGTLVARGSVHLGPGQDTRVQSYLFGGVHPDWRRKGIGTVLLAWQRGRALQQLATSDKTIPGWIMLYGEEATPGIAPLANGLGLADARWFTTMERPLTAPIPDFDVPQGIRVVRHDASLNEAVRLARNDAFRDHWGSQPSMQETWSSFVDGPTFRPDLSWLAIENRPDGERVVALVLTEINEEDWEVQGHKSAYIALVGVVRDWRGKRLAPLLLSQALKSHRAEGLDQTDLDVDTASPTGALGLYEGMGFAATNRSRAFVEEV
jgi:GNAT superfamily N-acetyltransferase